MDLFGYRRPDPGEAWVSDVEDREWGRPDLGAVGWDPVAEKCRCDAELEVVAGGAAMTCVFENLHEEFVRRLGDAALPRRVRRQTDLECQFERARLAINELWHDCEWDQGCRMSGYCRNGGTGPVVDEDLNRQAMNTLFTLHEYLAIALGILALVDVLHTLAVNFPCPLDDWSGHYVGLAHAPPPGRLIVAQPRLPGAPNASMAASSSAAVLALGRLTPAYPSVLSRPGR